MTGCAKIAVVLAIWLAAPGVGWTVERHSDQDADGVGVLLRAEGIAEELATPEGDWLLRRVLRHGFARTPALPERIAALARSAGPDSIAPSLDTAISRALSRDGIAARLRLWEGGAAERAPCDIPLVDHPMVNRYIDYFTGRGRWFFARWLARADRYIPLMRPILAAKGLPEDTVYLAMIESGFVAEAHSHAAAVGFWQFIRTTGKRFGLRQDTWVDERRDFIEATKSAADYLATLYGEFGDWQLAWAGYNAGGGRIRRALARYGVHDFWSLVDLPRSLAKETKQYVPKIMAAAIVATNRERYGFGDIAAQPALVFDELRVDDALALRRVASKLGVPLAELQALNPSLIYSITPPRRRFLLRVPAGRGAEVSRWLASLPRSERTDFRQHVVRSGDTLWEIAVRYGSTINAIREFNGIRDARTLGIGRRLIIPSNHGVVRRATTTSRNRKTVMALASPPITGRMAKAAASKQSAPVARHIVSAGETLWSISRQYEVSVQSLKRWNRRRGNLIGVGDVLEIF